jgi:hypothetical protein
MVFPADFIGIIVTLMPVVPAAWSVSHFIEFTRRAERVLRCKLCLGPPGECLFPDERDTLYLRRSNRGRGVPICPARPALS